MKIGFVGERGDYGEAAAASMFADEDIHTVPLRGLPVLFEALTKGDVEYGVVRFENSYIGVNPTLLDQLRQSNLYLCRETHLNELYHLAGAKGARLAEIRRIYAHPSAFAACGAFLEKLTGIDLVVTFDAASAALRLARTQDKTEATICSDYAAKIYGFAPIQLGIQDERDSITRFVALSRQLETPPDKGSEPHTSILFELKHEPGQMHAVMTVLRDHGINVHFLGSRPTRVNRWEYGIALELDGRISDEPIRTALADVKKHTIYLQVLGSYYRVEPKIQSARMAPVPG